MTTATTMSPVVLIIVAMAINYVVAVGVVVVLLFLLSLFFDKNDFTQMGKFVCWRTGLLTSTAK